VKINKLLKITNGYRFYDLVKAVYCINLCINNRSVLESCLALNACLIEYVEQGSQEINSYDSFENFFKRIYFKIFAHLLIFPSLYTKPKLLAKSMFYKFFMIAIYISIV